jgi:hypothetical protein
MVVELNFSGKKFYVTVKDQFWNAAKAALELTGIMSDTKMKECCVVAKLMEASNPKWPIKCKVPTDEGHDVILELFGKNHTVDIKVLYPNVGLTLSGATASAITEDLIGEIDHAYAKEKKQGNICCFDLSYLNTTQRQSIVGGIHNTYPNCITLEYDMLDAQLHVVWPVVNPGVNVPAGADKGAHVHKGVASPNWYKATATL